MPCLVLFVPFVDHPAMTAADTMLSQGFTELDSQHGQAFRIGDVLFTGLFSDPVLDQPLGGGIGLAQGEEHSIEITADRSQFGPRLPASGQSITHVKTAKTYHVIGVNHQPGSHLVVFTCKQPASP